MIQREGEGEEISSSNIALEKIPKKRRRRLLLLLEFLRNDNIFSVNVYEAIQSFQFCFSTLWLPTIKHITLASLSECISESGVWSMVDLW